MKATLPLDEREMAALVRRYLEDQGYDVAAVRIQAEADVMYRVGIPGPRGIDWDAQPLGQVTDHALARRLGLSRTAVRYARVARGIPPSDLHPKDVDWDAQPLGQMTDVDLAAHLKCSRAAVQKARSKRGIPAFHRRNKSQQ